ncbi:MAG: hypothetical protein A2X13_13110 [Bacteroidetes bacterium GWC2_33_15]|nr:MAG: hypothetical protein A2X10_15375 [Bacteroidetes bacterium GWA2_33_15]OFX50298.1 MAG: hypothetical protein A2X13_13110 [Bacteroidetes bacterium GWC2_33_15]OFX66784.1 MAG: hypothetical protein A2X15_08765 [Bacteroidetes bacterium GWB2_32_14]OFX69403.1 MAG: hypothetical protein A2X14_09695 [Bacteroidetes bacterium GWD2_33_33]HAN18726.1 NADH-quinone oxidoreductase subunit NuoE [Bacteroidales bacterium]
MPDIDSILEKYSYTQHDNLIPILQEIQDDFGYLSKEALVKVGDYLKIPTGKIYGLATFYSQFRFEPKGKYHIRICNGTSCHINSNFIILKELKKKLGINDGEVTKNGLFSLEETECMSGCGFGPVMMVNEKVYTRLTLEKVPEIIHFYLQIENE